MYDLKDVLEANKKHIEKLANKKIKKDIVYVPLVNNFKTEVDDNGEVDISNLFRFDEMIEFDTQEQAKHHKKTMQESSVIVNCQLP